MLGAKNTFYFVVEGFFTGKRWAQISDLGKTDTCWTGGWRVDKKPEHE